MTTTTTEDSVELFITVTRRIIQRDGVAGYLPTAIYPERRHIAVLEGIPDDLVGTERERAVLKWAEHLAVENEEFVVGLLHDSTSLKVLWRNGDGLRTRTVDLSDLMP